LFQTLRGKGPPEDIMRPENIRLGYPRRPARINNDDHVAGVAAVGLQALEVGTSDCIRVYEA